MQAFTCRTSATPAQLAILDYLAATGQIVADHLHRTGDGHIVLVLSEAEISVAKAHGLDLDVGAPLVPRAGHPEPGVDVREAHAIALVPRPMSCYISNLDTRKCKSQPRRFL